MSISLQASAQTLEQAVALALANNPEIKASYNQYVSSVKESDAAAGAYLPTLDLDAGIGYEGIRPASSTGNEDTDLTRKEASIILNQLIWDGNATLNDMDRTAADAESERLQLLDDASNLALQVTDVYLNAVKAKEVLALSESNLAVHKRIYRDIKRRVDSGIGSTADLTQVEARIARAQGNLLAAQNNLFDTHTQFERLVGQAPLGLIYPRADAAKIPLSLTDAMALALDNHPVIKVSAADVDAARFQYKQSKSPYYPTIYFEARQTWRDDAGGDRGGASETIAMLRLNYNLYNGGSDSDRSESAAYQLNRSKDLRDNAYRQVEEGLRLSWSALDLTLQQKDFLADHVDSASQTVIAYEKQYQIGQRTLLDLLNTENELFEARRDYLDAHYAEQYAKYRVMNAVGVLIDALLVDIPQEWTKKVEY
ncbi:MULTISPECIES: TolC family outer membrane protein [Vibrio]|uniref:TolC family outer membrane protein n=1 Tax=Vibrio ostreae TaxID=2841925 RepID=A0A975UBD6_9VIBR|nr:MULTISPECIES: TolC family outer membrane protein [Vibrio]QXO18608.1 TolC family outer membrane protein [Vibrio ostreae]WGY47099.1 TolC family outer membrane protein [Vibrio sp. ABG19]